MTTLKDQIKAAMKDAMRAKDKARLGTIRLIQSEFKRIEVDEKIEINDARALAVLDKMRKQRVDSITQFKEASRDDLAEKEQSELNVIQTFLPQALSENELSSLITEAIQEASATSMQDMGKVMGLLKPKVQGRADMGEVSKLIKAKLNA